jgi:hypothetical protein
METIVVWTRLYEDTESTEVLTIATIVALYVGI